MAAKTVNIAQYRGLVDTIAGVKDSVEAERERFRCREQELEGVLKIRDKQSSAIQKELSVQLRVANRSYGNLIEANHTLTEQVIEEKDRREQEVDYLRDQIKELKTQIKRGDNPLKEEVAKKELQIAKLHEASVALGKKREEAERALEPLRKHFEAEIQARDAQKETLLLEIESIRSSHQEAELQHEETLKEQSESMAWEKVQLQQELKDLKSSTHENRMRLEKEVKDQKLQIKGLDKQLKVVDNSQYIRQVEQKEKGYLKLVKDFERKQQLNSELMENTRRGFESRIKELDEVIQNNEREHERRLKPWAEKIDLLEHKISQLMAQREEMKAAEAEARQRTSRRIDELTKELEAAKTAVSFANRDSEELRKVVERQAEELKDNRPGKQLFLLQERLEQVTKQCQELVTSKDRELAQQIALVNHLQKRVAEENASKEELSRLWDSRVQEKEKGYLRVCADLEFANGQIVEEREHTAAARQTIRKRDAEIVRLAEVHAAELSFRDADRAELEAELSELERAAELDRRRFELKLEEAETHLEDARRRGEERVEDLRVEVQRRDGFIKQVEKELAEVRSHFERARLEAETKEREMEVQIRNRDRQIAALRNEIEFINDSWEIKYDRLMTLFEKAQKKVDDLIGPNTAPESQRRVKDLKDKNEHLREELEVLRGLIIQKDKEIQEYKDEIKQLTQETADIIMDKERGMADAVGQIADLQHKLRESQEKMERMELEKDQERLEMKHSYEKNIAQLKQVMEALRYTDREELVKKINSWKEAWQQRGVDMDDLEERMQADLEKKELQLQNMLKEFDEKHSEVESAKEDGYEQLQKLEAEWHSKEVEWQRQKEKAERLAQEMQLERDRWKREAEKFVSTGERSFVDQEQDVLKAQLQERDEQMKQIEAGKQFLIEENTRFRDVAEHQDEGLEGIKAEYESQLRAKDRQMEKMEREHQEIKEVLQAEMEVAQETCRAIEDQVRNLPNPFEDELTEMRDKYAQMQAGFMRINRENLKYREEREGIFAQHQKDIERLEKNLELAGMLLKEVASLGVLTNMSKDAMGSLEEALGIDLDGDGVVG